jgi:DNA-binding response OmpR family regulator
MKNLRDEELTIMLVEDDPDHADLIIRSLKEHPQADKIIHLSDGQDTLDYLKKQGDYSDKNPVCPDVIMLDLRLPKVDGLEVLREMKNDKNLNKIPVVVLTTSDAEMDIIQAYEFNANSYLVKPANFEEFAELINVLCEYWLSCNRPPFVV